MLRRLSSLSLPLHGTLRSQLRSTHTAPPPPPTGNLLASLRGKWQAQKAIFRAKRTEYIVKYGGSFFVVHELLGISSYVIVYSLVSAGVLDIWKVIRFAGLDEVQLKERLGKTWDKFQLQQQQQQQQEEAGTATSTASTIESSQQLSPSSQQRELSPSLVMQEEMTLVLPQPEPEQQNSKLMNFAMTVAVVKTLDVLGLVPLRYAITFAVTPRVARVIGPSVDRFFAALRRFFTGKKPSASPSPSPSAAATSPLTSPSAGTVPPPPTGP